MNQANFSVKRALTNPFKSNNGFSYSKINQARNEHQIHPRSLGAVKLNPEPEKALMKIDKNDTLLSE